MRILKTVLAFIAVFLVYHFVGCNIFQVNEKNELQAPAWYSVVGMFLSGCVAYFVYRRNRPHKKVRAAWGESDVDVAVRVVLETEQASVSMIERRTGWNYERAARAMEELERAGIVGPLVGSSPRQIFWDKLKQLNQVKYHRPSLMTQDLAEIDAMDGHAFEHWCADLLAKNGFTDVTVTQASGDQGVDIVAVKEGVHYAIQCKCYSSDLGNTPVQEVYAGKEMYSCQVGVVMTNRYFTAGAKQLAEKTRVLLWDRDKLAEMLEQAKQ